MWVNGVAIGTQTSWKTSNSFCGIELHAGVNVFAYSLQNQGTPDPNASAFITAIRIKYTGTGDPNTTETFVSDTTWKTHELTPSWQEYGFQDSDWAYANIVGAANDPPWNLPAAPGNPCNA